MVVLKETQVLCTMPIKTFTVNHSTARPKEIQKLKSLATKSIITWPNKPLLATLHHRWQSTRKQAPPSLEKPLTTERTSLSEGLYTLLVLLLENRISQNFCRYPCRCSYYRTVERAGFRNSMSQHLFCVTHFIVMHGSLHYSTSPLYRRSRHVSIPDTGFS